MINISPINDALKTLDSISLKEMDSVKLMNRTDTKFVFPVSILPDLLIKSKVSYRVLEINGLRTPSYNTLYFDTKNHQLFLDHHNGKPNRYKVRIRNYVESNLFFLEIKKKIKGRTDKHRIKVNEIENTLSENSKEFISKTIQSNLEFEPSLWNSFKRITLVNKNVPERITIDLNLTFSHNNQQHVLDYLVIAEVKQEKVNLNNPFIALLKEEGIRENSISKYCIGSLLCHSDLKYNNFKEKLLILDKLKKTA